MQARVRVPRRLNCVRLHIINKNEIIIRGANRGRSSDERRGKRKMKRRPEEGSALKRRHLNEAKHEQKTPKKQSITISKILEVREVKRGEGTEATRARGERYLGSGAVENAVAQLCQRLYCVLQLCEFVVSRLREDKSDKEAWAKRRSTAKGLAPSIGAEPWRFLKHNSTARISRPLRRSRLKSYNTMARRLLRPTRAHRVPGLDGLSSRGRPLESELI